MKNSWKFKLGVVLILAISLLQAVSGKAVPKRQEAQNPEIPLEQMEYFEGGKIPVLMYHHVGPLPQRADRIRKDLTVSPEKFAEQIQYLKEAGFHTVTTTDLLNYAKGEGRLPKKPIVLTFDDGYADVFQYAVPVLLAHQMRGTFAVITEYAGGSEYASWDTIRAAHDAGMEIIPHTRRHIDFKNKRYTQERLLEEIQGSVEDIQKNLGVTPKSFVYPYGHHTPFAVELLKQSNLELAFTTANGFFETTSDMLLQPRIRIHGAGDLTRFINSLQ